MENHRGIILASGVVFSYWNLEDLHLKLKLCFKDSSCVKVGMFCTYWRNLEEGMGHDSC